MTRTLQRPVVASRERHSLSADAFLYAAMIFLVTMVLQEGIAAVVPVGDMGTSPPRAWLEAIGALAMPLAAVGGPLLAWRTYGRHLGWRQLVVAVVGAILGGAVFGIAFFAIFFLTRLIPSPAPEEEGPWGMVIVTAIAVVAFLATPVVVAVRDLARTREHLRRHALRLAAVGLGLVAVIAAVFVGGETAELGMFLLLPAVPAAVAAIAMDWERARHQQSETVG